MYLLHFSGFAGNINDLKRALYFFINSLEMLSGLKVASSKPH